MTQTGLIDRIITMLGLEDLNDKDTPQLHMEHLQRMQMVKNATKALIIQAC